MSDTIPNQWRKVRVACVAMIATLALGFTGTAMAFASPADVDLTQTGSLTIHKQIEGSQTVEGTVNAAPGTGNGTPLADVEFTIWPIADETINLATSEGWQQLENFSVPASACPTSAAGTPTLNVPSATGGPAVPAVFGAAQTQVTSATTAPTPGSAVFADLDIAAYLVCETAAPANVLSTAAPFIVTVPSNKATDAAWVYDVNVYPKNEVSVPLTKVINADATAANVGQAEYSITATIPTLDTDEGLSYFMVRDPLNSNLNYSAALTGTTPIVLRDSAGEVVPLVAADYQLSEITTNDVLVSFTAAGLEKLAGYPGGTVTVTIGATVTLGVDTYSNSAEFYVDKFTGERPEVPTTPPRDPQESSKVVSTSGNLTIRKVNSDVPAETLAGAEFALYPAAAPFAAPGETCVATMAPEATALTVATGRVVTTDAATSDPVSNTAPTSTITTGSNGLVTVNGLFVDSTGSIPVSDTTTAPVNSSRCYVLVETKAPLGYVLNTAPTAVTVSVGSPTANTIEIQNTRSNLPDLPLTGAMGQLLLLGAGAALILLSVGAVVLIRQRQKTAN